MATSTSPSDGIVRTTDDVRVSRYDLLLAAMPVPMLVGWLGAVVVGLPTVSGMGVGSVFSALLLAYGLFVAPPRS